MTDDTNTIFALTGARRRVWLLPRRDMASGLADGLRGPLGGPAGHCHISPFDPKGHV